MKNPLSLLLPILVIALAGCSAKVNTPTVAKTSKSETRSEDNSGINALAAFATLATAFMEYDSRTDMAPRICNSFGFSHVYASGKGRIKHEEGSKSIERVIQCDQPFNPDFEDSWSEKELINLIRHSCELLDIDSDDDYEVHSGDIMGAKYNKDLLKLRFKLACQYTPN